MITPACELKPQRMVAIQPHLEVINSFIHDANDRGESEVVIDLCTLEEQPTHGQVTTIVRLLEGKGYTATYSALYSILKISWE